MCSEFVEDVRSRSQEIIQRRRICALARSDLPGIAVLRKASDYPGEFEVSIKGLTASLSGQLASDKRCEHTIVFGARVAPQSQASRPLQAWVTRTYPESNPPTKPTAAEAPKYSAVPRTRVEVHGIGCCGQPRP